MGLVDAGLQSLYMASLFLITVFRVTPDMCVAACVYLASGLLCRLRRGTATRWTFVLLGAVLGFGYLAKAIMLPLAFVFFAIAMFSLGSIWKAIPRVSISALIFLSVACPFVVALPRSQGRLTFGDAGKWNYVVSIDGVEPYFPKSSTLRHPVSKIFDAPAANEFAKPIGGTYPLWYDPPCWQGRDRALL